MEIRVVIFNPRLVFGPLYTDSFSPQDRAQGGPVPGGETAEGHLALVPAGGFLTPSPNPHDPPSKQLKCKYEGGVNRVPPCCTPEAFGHEMVVLNMRRKNGSSSHMASLFFLEK